MNCPNCGAPMIPVAGHDYYTCAYCTTFIFPEQNDDHVRVLAEPVGLSCPLCNQELVAGSVARARVGCCARCRGIVATRESFAGVVRALRSRAKSPAIEPQPVDHRQLKRRRACPRCSRSMDVHPYDGPGNIIIATCGACQMIWLDHGELSSVVDAPGSDRRR